MTANKVTLFDIPSKDEGGACWSLNTWKIRLSLNYKGIEYETQWVEYPDIAPTLKSFGITPWDNKDTQYTVPAVRFPDGAYTMNSKFIIEEIEKRYPSPEYPSLHVDDPMTKRADGIVNDLFDNLEGILLPIVPDKVLNDVSAEFFYRTRTSWLKMSLVEFGKKHGGEQGWLASKETSEKLAGMLKENPGPFLLGNTVSWADFVVVSFLHFVKRLVGDEEFTRLREWPEIIALYEASIEWLQRDKE